MGGLLVWGIAFGLALGLTPLAAALGRRWGLVDVPGGRRAHRGRVPRTGGVGLALAFLLTVTLTRILPANWFPASGDPKETLRLTGIMLGAAFIFFAGLWDDWRELSPRSQLGFQLGAAVIAISAEVFLERVMNPLTNQLVILPWPVVWGISLFWYLGMINTVNWLDGLDGLAAGVGAIVSAVLALHMWREGQYSVTLLPLALLGATLGFLPYNFHPARAFMGSAGAMFLGFTLAALSIAGGAKVATVLLVMGLPIVDVAWQIVSRIRAGRSPAVGDRGHLHFRLQDLGWSQRRIVLVYYVFCASFGALALLISHRLYKLVALLVLGVLVALALWWVARQPPENTP